MARAAHLIGLSVALLATPASAFDFKADGFKQVFRRTANAIGDTSIELTNPICRQERETEAGACLYVASHYFGGVASIVVVNARGTDTPELVAVSWDGDRRGRDTFHEANLIVALVTSGKAHEREGVQVAAEVRQIVSPETETREWHVGAITFQFRPSPQLGARGAVVFRAMDDQAAQPNSRE